MDSEVLEDGAYSDEEYVADHTPQDALPKKSRVRGKRMSRYSGETPLIRKNAHAFSKIYGESPELAFFENTSGIFTKLPKVR